MEYSWFLFHNKMPFKAYFMQNLIFTIYIRQLYALFM